MGPDTSRSGGEPGSPRVGGRGRLEDGDVDGVCEATRTDRGKVTVVGWLVVETRLGFKGPKLRLT